MILGAVYAIGTAGFYLLGSGKWTLGDCMYMTVISLTTVGYGEVLSGLHEVPYARLFTSVLLVAGAGITLYFISILTTFLVEGEFLQLRRKKRMMKKIGKLSDHIIVCGVGGTGEHVVSELLASQWDFVALDIDEAKLRRAMEAHPKKIVATIEGDATREQVLIEAGIERAYGIVAALPNDVGNLYVVVTARGLNPKLRIVAKAVDPSAERKLMVAGANAVISVNKIGGMRIASEMIRPHVVNFLDKMLHDKDKNLRFEEVNIPETSPLVGKKLAETDIRKERNLLIVAAKDPATNEYTYSPGPQFTLAAGMTLIVIGETECVQRFRQSKLFVSAE